MSGVWFARSRLLLNCAALHKQEMLCWDLWKLDESRDAAASEEASLLDELAALSQQADRAALRAFYAGDARFNLPETVTCFSSAVGPHPVPLRFVSASAG